MHYGVEGDSQRKPIRRSLTITERIAYYQQYFQNVLLISDGMGGKRRGILSCTEKEIVPNQSHQ